MIGYATVGTSDLTKHAEFYDAIAAELGAARVMAAENFIMWSAPAEGAAGLCLIKPYDGNAATVGNGVMVALKAADQAQVNRLHALALALGGADEGAPGFRGEGFYAAYFRDLDGNKLNAFCFG